MIRGRIPCRSQCSATSRTLGSSRWTLVLNVWVGTTFHKNSQSSPILLQVKQIKQRLAKQGGQDETCSYSWWWDSLHHLLSYPFLLTQKKTANAQVENCRLTVVIRAFATYSAWHALANYWQLCFGQENWNPIALGALYQHPTAAEASVAWCW